MTTEVNSVIGQIVNNRYQILELLGKKAGRQTLLALDQYTQDKVVIKLLTFNSEFGWTDLKLFEREAETLQSLSHPLIPRYLDSFEFNLPEGQGFALVQTYIDGRPLGDYLKTGRTFSEAQVKQIAEALLSILVYLHERQPSVIHRDIKPSNILLTTSNNSKSQVYLVDFGSVQTLASPQDGTITVVGTYGYMPPEQFGGRTTPSSDLYSLGATLIYLVTGKHPADLPQTNLRIKFEQAANISESFSNWLRWMTEPALEQRLASAKESLDALKSGIRPSSFLPASQTTSSFKITRGQVLWNAIWQLSIIGALLGGVCGTLHLMLETNEGVLKFSQLMPYGVYGGVPTGLTLGFLSGILIGATTICFFFPPLDINVYRLVTIGIAAFFNIFMALTLLEPLIDTGLNFIGGPRYGGRGLHNIIFLFSCSMAGLSQLFTDWYYRSCRKNSRLN